MPTFGREITACGLLKIPGGGGGRPLTENGRFKIHHLGPCLAYSMGKYGSSTKGREAFEKLVANGDIPKGSRLLCCFGEIDIRCHILKDGLGGMISRINSAINNYFKFIDAWRKDFNIMICGPIPSQKDNWGMNKEYPRVGTEIERNMATVIFNNMLGRECRKRGIKFLTLQDEILDDHLLTNPEFIADQCHLSTLLYPKAVKRLNENII